MDVVFGADGDKVNVSYSESSILWRAPIPAWNRREWFARLSVFTVVFLVLGANHAAVLWLPFAGMCFVGVLWTMIYERITVHDLKISGSGLNVNLTWDRHLTASPWERTVFIPREKIKSIESRTENHDEGQVPFTRIELTERVDFFPTKGLEANMPSTEVSDRRAAEARSLLGIVEE